MRLVVVSALLAIVLAASAPAQSINYSITINDPGGAYSDYYDEIVSNLQAAAAEWARFIQGSANLEIEVQITSSVALSSGFSVTSGFVRNNGTRDIFEQGAAYEIRAGTDPNGATPDIRLEINPDYLTNNLWFDPQPTMRVDPVPANRTDAISVFVHELGHAFVFNGWMNGTTGELPPTYLSTFDEHVTFDGTNFFFTGANAERLYGGAVPVTYGNPFHLGNTSPRPGANLISDLMNGVVFTFGTRYHISPLDVEIARDCGMTMDRFLKISAANRLPNHDFHLHGRGVPTAEHRVLAAANPAGQFDDFDVASGDANGNFDFEDMNSASAARGFYQVAYP